MLRSVIGLVRQLRHKTITMSQVMKGTKTSELNHLHQGPFASSVRINLVSYHQAAISFPETKSNSSWVHYNKFFSAKNNLKCRRSNFHHVKTLTSSMLSAVLTSMVKEILILKSSCLRWAGDWRSQPLKKIVACSSCASTKMVMAYLSTMSSLVHSCQSISISLASSVPSALIILMHHLKAHLSAMRHFKTTAKFGTW